MNDPELFCVTGSDGSGKSTQITRLTEFFNRQNRSVTAVSIWDAFTDPAVVAEMPIANSSEIYGYLRLLGPNSRPHFLFHAWHLALERTLARRPQILLLDGYWYKYMAAEVAHGADASVLRSLAAAFPEPDMTFNLRIDAEDALRRKSSRSDYENGYGDTQKFLQFQRRTQQLLTGLADELGWIEIDARLPPDEITGMMTLQLEKRGYGCAS
jgi:thymidylate kinase